jgi:manganese-dependent inorganic pyrophosphatase
MEPSKPTATMLLGAVMSDTVLLNSPTTTERDRVVVTYLERAIGLDGLEFGRAMFEASSDVSDVSAPDIVTRDAKEYQLGNGETISIAQIETVGKGLLDRKDELLDALNEVRDRKEYPFAALMVTDILTKGTDLLVSGDSGPVERAFDIQASSGVIPLPDVMSRKKQVAPKLLSAV